MDLLYQVFCCLPCCRPAKEPNDSSDGLEFERFMPPEIPPRTSSQSGILSQTISKVSLSSAESNDCIRVGTRIAACSAANISPTSERSERKSVDTTAATGGSVASSPNSTPRSRRSPQIYDAIVDYDSEEQRKTCNRIAGGVGGHHDESTHIRTALLYFRVFVLSLCNHTFNTFK